MEWLREFSEENKTSKGAILLSLLNLYLRKKAHKGGGQENLDVCRDLCNLAQDIVFDEELNVAKALD